MSHSTSTVRNFSPPGEKDDGRWLCADGPYLNRIRASCNLQPALRLPDPRNHAVDLRDRPARVTLFSFPQSGGPQRSDFGGEKGPEELGLHFKSKTFVHGKQIRNVYLLENLNPDYVAVFGDALQIDPKFFVDHERNSGELRLPSEPSIATRLPSLLSQSRSLMMEYHELRNPDRQFQSFNLSCAESGRDLWTTRLGQRWEYPVILHQKCSFWTISFEKDSWSVLILCDPPVKKAHVWSKHGPDEWHRDRIQWQRKLINVNTTPFQGGCSDFIPRKLPLNQTDPGPPRQGLFDDLCYYLARGHETLPSGINGPLDTTVFAKKIVASQYLHVIAYNQAILSTMEYPLQRIVGLGQMEVELLEQQWSDIQMMCARCAHYLKSVSSIMLRLGIPSEAPSDSNARDSTWTESDSDFQYIHAELKSLVERAIFLNESLTGLTGIVGNRQALAEARRSIREAKSVKALTLVGMIFIPLAFTTSMFSMADGYLPGKEHFWTFFAVSIPLVLLVFAGTSLFDIGYDTTGSWNPEFFRRRLHGLAASFRSSP